MLSVLVPLLTSAALGYASQTGRLWEPFFAWIGTMSFIVAIEAQRTATAALTLSYQAVQLQSSQTK